MKYEVMNIIIIIYPDLHSAVIYSYQNLGVKIRADKCTDDRYKGNTVG